MPDAQILRIEKLLAIAHSVLWEAAALAESRRDQSLSEDLHGLTGEVGRLNVSLLEGRRPRRAAQI